MESELPSPKNCLADLTLKAFVMLKLDEMTLDWA